jgi:hypothetical protein
MIKNNADYKYYFVNKKFGSGKKVLVEFYYRDQVIHFKQKFLVYVSKKKFDNDPHGIMQEVQNYLMSEIGVIDYCEFTEYIYCDKCRKIDGYHCKNHEKEFSAWVESEFPKIDLYYGGMSYFGVVKD